MSVCRDGRRLRRLRQHRDLFRRRRSDGDAEQHDGSASRRQRMFRHRWEQPRLHCQRSRAAQQRNECRAMSGRHADQSIRRRRRVACQCVAGRFGPADRDGDAGREPHEYWRRGVRRPQRDWRRPFAGVLRRWQPWRLAAERQRVFAHRDGIGEHGARQQNASGLDRGSTEPRCDNDDPAGGPCPSDAHPRHPEFVRRLAARRSGGDDLGHRHRREVERLLHSESGERVRRRSEYVGRHFRLYIVGAAGGGVDRKSAPRHRPRAGIHSERRSEQSSGDGDCECVGLAALGEQRAAGARRPHGSRYLGCAGSARTVRGYARPRRFADRDGADAGNRQRSQCDIDIERRLLRRHHRHCAAVPRSRHRNFRSVAAGRAADGSAFRCESRAAASRFKSAWRSDSQRHHRRHCPEPHGTARLRFPDLHDRRRRGLSGVGERPAHGADSRSDAGTGRVHDRHGELRALLRHGERSRHQRCRADGNGIQQPVEQGVARDPQRDAVARHHRPRGDRERERAAGDC